MRIIILHPIAEQGARFGTELVAQELALCWQAQGCDVTLVGHAPNGRAAGFAHFSQIPLITLPPLPGASKWITFHMRSAEAPGLKDLLGSTKPDAVFVIGLGPDSINLAHLEAISECGIPCALWHHVPGITCQQHGLRYKNRALCDGEVKIGRCARCRLSAACVPEPVAYLASFLPLPALAARLPGPLAHLAAARAMSGAFHSYVHQLPRYIKLVFAGAQWAKEVLIRNGFAPSAVALIRPGVRQDLARAIASQAARGPEAGAPLRLLFWGRLEDTKGVDTAILAVRALQTLPLTLTIAGGFDPAVPFQAKLAKLAAGDDRIQFAGRLEPAELAAALSQADVALIPSPWLETGPLTVFEAHAARLPILGARTGGIAEICQDDPSARLFERNDYMELAGLIRELAENREELDRRRTLVPPARTMEQVAREVLSALRALSGQAGNRALFSVS
jgi:glycosyltransferase involved in cell wall biosynthesis